MPYSPAIRKIDCCFRLSHLHGLLSISVEVTRDFILPTFRLLQYFAYVSRIGLT